VLATMNLDQQIRLASDDPAIVPSVVEMRCCGSCRVRLCRYVDLVRPGSATRLNEVPESVVEKTVAVRFVTRSMRLLCRCPEFEDATK
jgi:hypothetical protein